MNDPAQPDQRLRRRDEVAPHIALPDPEKRRFPVGAVLIVAWIAVFLTIFIVLAQLKLKGPTPPSPGMPTPPPSSAPSGD